jgi:hypothetical protein
MFKCGHITVFLAVILGLFSESLANDVAVDFNISTSQWGGMVAGSNHGWQFTANQSITVTHLGLYDEWPDGFSIDHPIGLWRLNDGSLLASGTMSAGTGDTLTDHFRYIDIPDVQLSVGMDYVVGFYSAFECSNEMIIKADGLQVNPAISLVVGRYDVGGQFQMPANPIPTEGENPWDPPPDPDRFGPNFLFEVPEPYTLILLGIGGIFLRKRNLR